MFVVKATEMLLLAAVANTRLPAVQMRAIPAMSQNARLAAEDRLSYLQRALSVDPAVAAAMDAASELVMATAGLRAGSAASAEQTASVLAAVATLERVAPCKLRKAELMDSLSGSWEMVWSSALARSRAAGRALVPAPLPPLAEVVAVSQTYGSSTDSKTSRTLEEQFTVALPAPFPLPKQQVELIFTQRVEATGDPGKYRVTVERAAALRRGRRVPLPSPRQLVESVLDAAVGPILPLERSLLSEIEPRERRLLGEQQLRCTATVPVGPDRVRVVRSSLGELTVFIATGEAGDARGALPGTADEVAEIRRDADGDTDEPRGPVGAVDALGRPIEEVRLPLEPAARARPAQPAAARRMPDRSQLSFTFTAHARSFPLPPARSSPRLHSRSQPLRPLDAVLDRGQESPR